MQRSDSVREELGRADVRWPSVLVLAFVLWAALTPTSARADLRVCQTKLQAASKPLVTRSLSAMQKCLNLYRKAEQTPAAIADAAADCQNGLAKAILFPDVTLKSTAAKVKIKLNNLYTSGKCTNEDLLMLGHLPPSSFGDMWTNAIVVITIQTMLGNCQSINGSCKPTLAALFATGSCPLCGDLDPIANCALAATSNACFDSDPLPDVSLGLSGTFSFQVAPFGGLLIAWQGPQGYPINYGGGTTLCLRSLGLVGVISGITTSFPTVSYSMCQDHSNASPDTPECTGICFPDTTDTVHSGVTNGGKCYNFTLSGPDAGQSVFLMWVSEQFVFPGLEGPDALPCTADDVVAPSDPMLAVLTTATASATTLDTDATNNLVLANGPTCPLSVTGQPFNFTAMSGLFPNPTGGRLVSTTPMLHGPIGDQVQTFGLNCQ